MAFLFVVPVAKVNDGYKFTETAFENVTFTVTTVPGPAVPVFDVVTPVIVAGAIVTEDEAADGEDVPLVLVAVTVNVYAVFGLSPFTVMGEVLPVPVIPPGVDVAV